MTTTRPPSGKRARPIAGTFAAARRQRVDFGRRGRLHWSIRLTAGLYTCMARAFVWSVAFPSSWSIDNLRIDYRSWPWRTADRSLDTGKEDSDPHIGEEMAVPRLRPDASAKT
jgi:hypothetical protein